MNEEIKSKKPSLAWYFLPIFFGMITSPLLAVASGVAEFLYLRRVDRNFAKKVLIVGIVMGILAYPLGLVYHSALKFLLKTDIPVIIVASTSMQHDNPEITHYRWLQDKFGYERSYVNSWPLSRGFNRGDVLIVKGSNEYEIGEVIAYKVKNLPYPVVHRIVALNEDGTYQTKSDNNPEQLIYEKIVEKSQVAGKVIWVIPQVGKLKLFRIN